MLYCLCLSMTLQISSENDGNANSDDDHVTFCVEDMLKSAGILSSGNDMTLIPNHGDDPRNLVGMNLPPKKVWNH